MTYTDSRVALTSFCEINSVICLCVLSCFKGKRKLSANFTKYSASFIPENNNKHYTCIILISLDLDIY